MPSIRRFTHNGRNFYGLNPLALSAKDLKDAHDLERFKQAHRDRMGWLDERQQELEEKRCLSPGLRDKIEQCFQQRDDLFRRMDVHRCCYGINPSWDKVPELIGLGLSAQEQNWEPEARRLINEYYRWTDQLNDVYFDVLEAYAKMVSPSQK